MFCLFLVLICVTRPCNVPGMLRRDISRRFIIIIIITLFDSHSVWLYAPVCTRRRGGEIYPIAFQTSPVPVRGFLCTVFRRFLTSEHPSLYINLEKLFSTGLHKYSGLQIPCGCSVGVVCPVFGRRLTLVGHRT